MGLEAEFNRFRDDNFRRFLRRLLSGDEAASYMSGVADEFKNNSENLKKINLELSSRGGLVSSFEKWIEFVPPPEATRFLLQVDDVEEGADLLDAVAEQERPADSNDLLKVFKQNMPNSMRAIMLGVGGDSRRSDVGRKDEKTILKPKNKSGLNLEAMKNFR